MNTLTLEIYPQDCVGDSSAKHNYNAASLDTAVCNLSSDFFLVDNNFSSVFADFQNNLSNFNIFAQQFGNPSNLKSANTTVNLLSSYWNQHEFTVHYPLNIKDLNNLSCPTINQNMDVLKSMANVFLTNNYPAINYTSNTIANVLFFLYSVPVDPTDPSKLQSTVTGPEFSFYNRTMNPKIIRQDIHFVEGVIFKFKNINSSSWSYFSTLTPNSLSAVKNNFNYITKPNNVRITSISNRNTINITVDANTFNYDVYLEAINSGKYNPSYSDIIITVSSTVTIGSRISTIPSLIVTSANLNNNSGFIDGDTVTIINNGNIIGAGGDGGDGQTWGSVVSPANDGNDGGDAIQLQFNTTIVNNGIIAGGGGGGAGGYAGTKNTLDSKDLKSKTGITTFVGGGGGGGGAGVVTGNYGKGASGYNNITEITLLSLLPVVRLKLDGNIKLIKSNKLNGDNGKNGNATTGGAGGSKTTAKGGAGGNLGVAGTSTGKYDKTIFKQYSPKGGAAGNYINGKTYAAIQTLGYVYGNIS